MQFFRSWKIIAVFITVPIESCKNDEAVNYIHDFRIKLF